MWRAPTCPSPFQVRSATLVARGSAKDPTREANVTPIIVVAVVFLVVASGGTRTGLATGGTGSGGED
jgi:hypothetical protein